MTFNDQTLQTFRDSMNRCQANPQFLNRFYNKFVIANPAVREKFANTNMEDQKMMLHASLYMIALATQGNRSASMYLDNVAKRHAKADLDIPAELYDLWLETLIQTVSETDDAFDEQIESAWREVMLFGISFMESRYED